MQELDAQVGKHVAAKALVLGGRTLRSELVGFFDERADDERLTARVHLLAHECVRIGTVVRRHDTRRHREPPGRHLAQLAEVDVAVQRQRQRARDGGRCHGKKVRHVTGFLSQSLPLRNAEAVLLVDNCEPEVLHHHVVLDQRVRAHDQRIMACRKRLDHLASRLGSRAADEHAGRQPVPCQELIEGGRMLPRQDFRGRHDRRLPPCVVRHQRSHGRHDRFAAAHIALQEPVHRARSGEVGENLMSRHPLAIRELEWQRRCESTSDVDVVADHDAGGLPSPATRTLRSEL